MGFNDLVDRYKQNAKELYKNIESGKLQEDIKKMAQDYSENEKRKKEEYQQKMSLEIPDPEDNSFVYASTFNENSKTGRIFVYEDRLVLIYKDTLETKIYEYSNLKNVKKFMGSMCITNSEDKDVFLYIDNEKQKLIMQYVQDKMGISDTSEIMRKCKVCGKVWCYTVKQLKAAQMGEFSNSMASLGASLGAMSGNYRTVIAANSSHSQTVDYEKCPNCGSANSEIIKDIEPEQKVNTIESEVVSVNSKTDVPDELRKYKSLLDDGIITEEEFSAKKKQLLGL